MDNALILDMLVQSVACGDDGLRARLEVEAPIIWCMTAGCRPDLHYLKAQLGIIDYAMLYARNQIDLSNSRQNSYGESKSKSDSERDSAGTREARYVKCGWSTATSWQQFQRNSEQHDRGRSDSATAASGASSASSWDRSKQKSEGWAHTWANSVSASDAQTDSQARAFDMRTSESQSGTPGWDGSGNVDPWSFSIEVDPPTFSIDWPPLQFNYTIGSISIIAANDDYYNPGPVKPHCGDDETPWCDMIPSYGRGWSNRYSLTISLPTVEGSTSWGSGENFQQSFVCSHGKTYGAGLSWSETIGATVDTASGDSANISLDKGETQHDAHRSGSSYSDSDSAGSSSLRGIMHSLGETDSGADSAGHSEQSSTGTSAQHSKSWAQSDGSSYDDSVTTGEARYWSQIFRSLNDMWQRVLGEITQAERIHLSSAPALYGVLPATIGKPCCDAVPPSYMTVRPRPVKVRMPSRVTSPYVGMLQ